MADPLDSKKMFNLQTGSQPLLLETISSNESRYTGSPNFMVKSKNSTLGGGMMGSIDQQQF